jgi:hypothetical protein
MSEYVGYDSEKQEKLKKFENLRTEASKLLITIMGIDLEFAETLRQELIYRKAIEWKQQFGEDLLNRTSFYHILVGGTAQKNISPDLNLEGGGC